MYPTTGPNEDKKMVPIYKYVSAANSSEFTWARCTDAGSGRAIDWEVSLRIHNANESAKYMDGQIIYDAKLSRVSFSSLRDESLFANADMTMSRTIFRAE